MRIPKTDWCPTLLPFFSGKLLVCWKIQSSTRKYFAGPTIPLGNHMPTHVATIDVRSFMNLGDDSHENKSMKSMYILHIAYLSLAYLKLTCTFTEYNVETFFLGGISFLKASNIHGVITCQPFCWVDKPSPTCVSEFVGWEPSSLTFFFYNFLELGERSFQKIRVWRDLEVIGGWNP